MVSEFHIPAIIFLDHLWPSHTPNYCFFFKLIIVIQYAAFFDPNTSINHPQKIIAPRHYTAAATPLPCSTWPQRRKRWWLRRSCFRRGAPYGRQTPRRGRGPTPIDLGHLGYPLVNCYITMERSIMLSMRKSTISIAIFNCYVWHNQRASWAPWASWASWDSIWDSTWNILTNLSMLCLWTRWAEEPLMSPSDGVTACKSMRIPGWS